MKICLVLTLALVADFAMGDIDMCFMEKQTKTELRTFVNHYPENNHVYFGVKSCPENRLEIGATFFRYYFSIKFGRTKTETGAVRINKYDGGGIITKWSSEQVMLNCDEVKYFWMKWSKGELAIGQGLELGSRTLYTFNDADVRSELYSGLVHVVYKGTAEFENQCGILFKKHLCQRSLPLTSDLYRSLDDSLTYSVNNDEVMKLDEFPQRSK
ncbi:hypothetical protein CAPTEDRAFT_217149 [Capitella teleta]|uniref:Farnesoic acid O-methyl transferase domain-containing protein n=1 Tax=Capitella teleta TaxID=283909 RepID=R7VK86_CAPTE|nr:hypothetical protein CAPTEDRAFT_217149 [Capitella teleta]|eukprot:ELU17126.1 hypothetical protein CAPTEDRAFT_217149 [Capitella teleta]